MTKKDHEELQAVKREIDRLADTCQQAGIELAALRAEKAEALAKHSQKLLDTDKFYQGELQKCMKYQLALEFMGLPDLDDPNFDAQVTHTAFLRGRLERKR